MAKTDAAHYQNTPRQLSSHEDYNSPLYRVSESMSRDRGAKMTI